MLSPGCRGTACIQAEDDKRFSAMFRQSTQLTSKHQFQVIWEFQDSFLTQSSQFCGDFDDSLKARRGETAHPTNNLWATEMSAQQIFQGQQKWDIWACQEMSLIANDQLDPKRNTQSWSSSNHDWFLPHKVLHSRRHHQWRPQAS